MIISNGSPHCWEEQEAIRRAVANKSAEMPDLNSHEDDLDIDIEILGAHEADEQLSQSIEMANPAPTCMFIPLNSETLNCYWNFLYS